MIKDSLFLCQEQTMAFPPSEDTHNTNEKLVEKTCTTLSQIIVISSETSFKDH